MTASVRLTKTICIFKAQLLLGFLLFITGCDHGKSVLLIEGESMGTTYSIKVVDDLERLSMFNVKMIVDSILIQVNKQMSTWDPNSEISKFNRWQSTEPYKVSKSFLRVVENALVVSEETGGMFDITIYDLMSLWGFGPSPKLSIPNKSTIESVLSYTGYDNINCDQNQLIKKNQNTKLDLNSIAKGYGVDIVFNSLKDLGFKNIFVEIGGEIRLAGFNEKNIIWTVGLENPSDSSLENNRPFFGVIKNDLCAIATSANYRNIVDIDGTVLGHTINPKTGFPIQTDVLSVTVIAEKCMIADAWATALMTLSYKSGLELVKEQENMDVIWTIISPADEIKIAVKGNQNIIDPIYPIK